MKQFKQFNIILTVLLLQECVKSKVTFNLEYQWQYINFTWRSAAEYNKAIQLKRYIPENCATLGSIKFYEDRIYFALPHLRMGVPISLGYISLTDSPKKNALITPYPSWEKNDRKDCRHVQNVLSMEIDKNGIMWIIDGIRNNGFTKCPPKLLLLDLNRNGKEVLIYTFPSDTVQQAGAFLNDIVIDDIDGGYAYITDNSLVDPGLVVFSRKQKRSWKLRDPSVFADPSAAGFIVNGLTFNQLSPINGIALSPTISSDKERIIYYSALTSLYLNSLSSVAARNYTAYETGDWRKYVKVVGKKQNTGDGMAMDNKGNLYYGILSEYAVAIWNMKEPFSKAKIIAQDRNTMNWVDAFGFDNKGNTYMIADNGNRFLDTSLQLKRDGVVRFRIFKADTGTKSYQYN